MIKSWSATVGEHKEEKLKKTTDTELSIALLVVVLCIGISIAVTVHGRSSDARFAGTVYAVRRGAPPLKE